MLAYLQYTHRALMLSQGCLANSALLERHDAHAPIACQQRHFALVHFRRVLLISRLSVWRHLLPVDGSRQMVLLNEADRDKLRAV